MGKEIRVNTQHIIPAANESWHSFRQEVDRIFDRFSDGFESVALQPFTRMQQMWSPGVTGFAPLAVDVAENGKSYVITAELPGVEEKNVEVSVDDDLLVIKGEKRQEKEEKDNNHYLSERSYGSFQRMFTLPRGTDTAGVQANFHNGVLTVTVPKVAQSQNARKIEIKAA